MGLNSQLARFAVHSNELKSSGINPKLFRPTKERKVSVSRIEDKTEEETIEEGKRVVRIRQDVDTLYGWAEIATREVYDIGLSVDDDDDPPGHSNIIGWPEEEKKFLKCRQELAKRSAKKQLPKPIQVTQDPTQANEINA